MNMNDDDKQLLVGATYMDANGKCVRVTQIDSRNVNWIDVDGTGTGSTDVMQFVRNYHRTQDPGQAA
jgi:hypothetical protein